MFFAINFRQVEQKVCKFLRSEAYLSLAARLLPYLKCDRATVSSVIKCHVGTVLAATKPESVTHVPRQLTPHLKASTEHPKEQLNLKPRPLSACSPKAESLLANLRLGVDEQMGIVLQLEVVPQTAKVDNSNIRRVWMKLQTKTLSPPDPSAANEARQDCSGGPEGQLRRNLCPEGLVKFGHCTAKC